MPVISVQGLSKHYRLSPDKSGSIANFLRSRMFVNLPEQARLAAGRSSRISNGILRALDDVSFEVHQGEVLGIMGPNGAGKSTLLKVLSRITAPTAGRARLRGRVGALLEIGTGFNYELSGRENIYLNGLTLGMTREEIDRKFDEIVEFSGVEAFLATPVKRYSSGMVTRLGFSVAVHLEPEILVIDEILAVGDAEFQRKCIGKMRDVAKDSGKVVLFISHSVEAVLAVCSRAIRLEGGRLVQDGPAADVVAAYLGAASEKYGDASLMARDDREGTREAMLVNARVEGRSAENAAVSHADTIYVGQPFSVLAILSPAHDRVRDVSVELWIRDMQRTVITVLSNVAVGRIVRAAPSTLQFAVNVRRCTLVPGHYWIDAVVKAEDRIVDKISGIATFVVVSSPFFDDLTLHVPGGAVLVEQEWTTTLA